ncbi:hypothetical protein J7M07_06745 [bacterium]|nr:hypothetical protein [bacterium]
MKELIVFSILSFVLILAGVLFYMGFITVGPTLETNTRAELSGELGELKMQLTAMEAMKMNIDRKRKGILALEGDLEIERKVVADSRNELTNYLDRIENALEETDKERLDRISKLAKLYNSMKPKEAAGIASSLKVELLMEIISKMKERKAAGLMEALPPALASNISRRLGERKVK